MLLGVTVTVGAGYGLCLSLLSWILERKQKRECVVVLIRDSA